MASKEFASDGNKKIKSRVIAHTAQTVDKALLLQGFAIVGAAFLI